jgi:hypothetical protein
MFDPTTLIASAWLWDKYGDDFTKWLKEKAEKTGVEFAQTSWKKFQWQQAEKNYKEKLAKLHGTTRILGHSEPTPLEGIFTDLYILDKPLALRRYNLDDLQGSDEKLHGGDVDRREGLMLIKREYNHHLFILGKPGAGKTTFLKYTTLQTVKGEIEKTPIFIGLREWAESKQTLMDFIIEQFSLCNFPKADSFIEYLLEKGNAILLLDGLDEVNSEYNARIIEAVKLFCKKYDKNKCLISCRVASADYSFESFKYMEVADFTPTQIETFVSKWFTREPIKRDKFLTEFRQAQYRGLRELASSPLLLGMLCLAFADSMEFTTRRVDIYEDAIDALLRKWDSSRSISRDVIYQGLNHHLKKRLFTIIAYKTFSDNKYLIKEQDLANYLEQCLKKLPNNEKQELDGEVVLKAIEAQHGIFVERAQKIHSFSHLTFQEYFTACAIKGNVSYQKELMYHITDPRWREVFLLTVSLLDDADEFFEIFKAAVTNLISQDEILIKFSQWAELKANSVQCNYRIREVRGFYIFLELVGTSNLALALNLDLDIEHILELASDLDFALDRTIDINLIHARVINLDFADTCIRALDLTYAFEYHSKDISSDYLLYIILLSSWIFVKTDENYFKELINNNHQKFIDFYLATLNKIHELGFESIVLVLTPLKNKIPHKSAAQNDWKLFAEQLTSILQTQRNIGKQWSFTYQQNELMAKYFSANSLLLDCLKLATVSDREAIKNSLFLPPLE